jgi:ABC-type antimicrobial peptide transport system permease subunit
LQLIILVMVALGVVNLVNMAVLERIGEFGTMRRSAAATGTCSS